MGVTVHWSGSVKDRETVDKIISYAKFFADSLGWEVNYVNDKGIVADMKTTYLDGKVSHWYHFESDKDAKRMGRTGEPSSEIGIVINPKEPFRTESIGILFHERDGKWETGEFCKTQVFSDKELPNLIAHELLITMLQTIKNTWMPDLKISDEGALYRSKEDRSKRSLDEDVAYWKENNYPQADIDKWVKEAKEWEPYNYNTLAKAHGANLNMIKDMGKKLQQAGFDKMQMETPAGSSFLEDLKEEDNKKKKLPA